MAGSAEVDDLATRCADRETSVGGGRHRKAEVGGGGGCLGIDWFFSPWWWMGCASARSRARFRRAAWARATG